MQANMQAIQTKYLPATNTKGARIKASAWAGAHTQSYDYALELYQNHKAAAMSLAAEKGWLEDNTLHGGELPDNAMAWVLVPKQGE